MIKIYPDKWEDWLNIATERSKDADKLSERDNRAGSIYMAGYAIECSLKAYLKKTGKRFPAAGSAGHNLKELWRASGFRLKDLRDDKGEITFYIEEWSTDLRYAGEYSFPAQPEVLLQGAKNLVGRIQAYVRNYRRNIRR